MDLFENIPEYAQKTINEHMVLAALASPAGTFIPAVDLVAVYGIWGMMVCKLAGKQRTTLSKSDYVKIGLIFGKSILAYQVGSKLLTTAVNWASLGLASIPTTLLNATLNAAYTFMIGCAFQRMLNEFDMGEKTVEEMSVIALGYLSFPGASTLFRICRMVRSVLLSRKNDLWQKMESLHMACSDASRRQALALTQMMATDDDMRKLEEAMVRAREIYDARFREMNAEFRTIDGVSSEIGSSLAKMKALTERFRKAGQS